ILNGKVEIPEYFDPDAKDLVEKLLTVEVTKRLGCMKNGVEDIKKHPWFSDISWDTLTDCNNPGPLNPGITKEGDTHNFYKYSDVAISEEPDSNVDYDAIFADF